MNEKGGHEFEIEQEGLCGRTWKKEGKKEMI